MKIKFIYIDELFELDRVFNGLKKDSIRLVGGAVRNFLLGREIYDYDLCSTFKPDEIKQILDENKIKYLTIGEKHGTITAVINNKLFETTTLREDHETDGRHAKVVYSDSYETDSNVRDFTINALYLDFQGNIYDYHRGLDDIKSGIIRFIGNADKRIGEDHLRILRFFRFFSYYGKEMDMVGLESCIKHRDTLNRLSGERIRLEMVKILWSTKVIDVLETMEKNGILSEIMKFQEINMYYFKTFISYKNFPDINEIFPVALILNNLEELEYLKNRWKLSNCEFALCKKLISAKNNSLYSNYDIKRNLFVSGDRVFVKNLVALNSIVNGDSIIDFNNKMNFINEYTIPKFPISGNDLKQFNIEPREYGKVLERLREFFIESDYSLNREELLNNISPLMFK